MGIVGIAVLKKENDMEKLTNKNPCDNCTSDKQIGNPYYWQCECDKCLKSVKWRSECVKRLKDYEDLEEQCIKENTWSLRLLLKKWKEFFEDIAKLYEYRELEEQGLLLKLPISIGDTVYVLCECGMIPQQLDGTLYSSDGSLGTATGYYCPYEDDCPHDCEECDDLFDCDKFKQKSAVFEDTVKSITLEDGTIYISTENCDIYSPLGYAVFLTKAEAEKELKKMESEE